MFHANAHAHAHAMCYSRKAAGRMAWPGLAWPGLGGGRDGASLL